MSKSKLNVGHVNERRCHIRFSNNQKIVGGNAEYFDKSLKWWTSFLLVSHIKIEVTAICSAPAYGDAKTIGEYIIHGGYHTIVTIQLGNLKGISRYIL